MKKHIALLTFLAAVAFAIAPVFSRSFGGFDPSLFPYPQENPPVQPAGYAFAIWGVIYLWLIIATFLQWRRFAHHAEWNAMQAPLLLSLVAGIPWVATALVSPLLATVLILVMWVGAARALSIAPLSHQMIGLHPVGLYTGWLTAASCVSIALILSGYLGMNQVLAALIALTIALIIGTLAITFMPKAYTFSIALAWALIAIYIRNLSGGGSNIVQTTAFVGAIFVIGFAAYRSRKG